MLILLEENIYNFTLNFFVSKPVATEGFPV